MPGAATKPRVECDSATSLLAAHGAAWQRTARRFSICADDADDAFARALEILLRKAPALEPRRLVAWMQVVTRREALAVRRERERLLGAGDVDPGEVTSCDRRGPAERYELRERSAAAARLLARLKPDERRALALQAEGYSYAEICARTGWTYTKVNRCLAEGRARLRRLGGLAE